MNISRKISVNDEMFEKMRTDADEVLQALVGVMMQKNSQSGSMTIKVDVTFQDEAVSDPEESETDNKWHTAKKPTFKHTVSYAVQITDKKNGTVSADLMEAILDEETGEYVFRPIRGAQQMNLFETEGDQERTDNDGEKAEQAEIEGRSFMALPAPETDEGDVIDGDYKEVPPSDDTELGGTEFDMEYDEPDDEAEEVA